LVGLAAEADGSIGIGDYAGEYAVSHLIELAAG
jgi:hypothetical protein